MHISGLLIEDTWHQKDSEQTGMRDAAAVGKPKLPWGEEEYFQFSQMYSHPKKHKRRALIWDEQVFL